MCGKICRGSFTALTPRAGPVILEKRWKAEASEKSPEPTATPIFPTVDFVGIHGVRGWVRFKQQYGHHLSGFYSSPASLLIVPAPIGTVPGSSLNVRADRFDPPRPPPPRASFSRLIALRLGQGLPHSSWFVASDSIRLMVFPATILPELDARKVRRVPSSHAVHRRIIPCACNGFGGTSRLAFPHHQGRQRSPATAMP